MHFTKEGSGTKQLVLLHGWPGDLHKWDALVSLLKDRYTLYRIDFAGWGGTPLTRAYTLEDYAEDVRAFMKEERIVRPIIVGHSFGGRVAIKLVSSDPALAEKLILIASAGIERKSLVVRTLLGLKGFVPNFIKKFMRPLVASPDYLQLSGEKRETFVNVISENLESLLHKITTPTLLIWGRHDHLTPLSQGRLMEKRIPMNRFVLISEGDHGIPYRSPKEVARAIIDFV